MGRVYDGAVAAAVAADPDVGVENVVIPVVAECDDSWLSEARVVHVEAEDAGRAVAAASTGPVAEGAVGAGTGMTTKGFKAGIGTSSRVVPELGEVGVLVLANFSAPPGLVVDGVAVGDLLTRAPGPARRPAGSCIVVVAALFPSYLVDHLHLSMEQMGFVLSSLGFGGAIGSLSLPALSAPASVTTLSVPTLLFANVAVPPVRLTVSFPRIPANTRSVAAAELLPS